LIILSSSRHVQELLNHRCVTGGYFFTTTIFLQLATRVSKPGCRQEWGLWFIRSVKGYAAPTCWWMIRALSDSVV